MLRSFYDMPNDFGLGTDLSAEHPDKLKEFQELFDREARKHNIYPMANSCYELLAADRPKLVSGNNASFTPGTVRLPEEAISTSRTDCSPSSPRSKTQTVTQRASWSPSVARPAASHS
jgi:hypothetical protein